MAYNKVLYKFICLFYFYFYLTTLIQLIILPELFVRLQHFTLVTTENEPVKQNARQ